MNRTFKQAQLSNQHNATGRCLNTSAIKNGPHPWVGSPRQSVTESSQIMVSRNALRFRQSRAKQHMPH